MSKQGYIKSLLFFKYINKKFGKSEGLIASGMKSQIIVVVLIICMWTSIIFYSRVKIKTFNSNAISTPLY